MEPADPDGPGAWARLDGRGRGIRAKGARPPRRPRARDATATSRAGSADGAAGLAAAHPDLATRRRPPGPFAAEPGRGPGRGRLLAGAGLAVLAAALLVLGTVLLVGRDAGPRAAPAPGAAAGDDRLASFDLPRTWIDRTAELAGRVKGVRPSFVFQGPVTDGFAADVNVVRQPRGSGDPPLDQLVELVAGQVSAQLDATRLGGRRVLALDGERAVAYDYRYQADGRRLRARQLAVLHGGSVVFVNFTTTERVFARDLRALDQMVASWRWR